MLTWAIIIGFAVFMGWPIISRIRALRRELQQRSELMQQQAARPPAGPPPAIDDRPLLRPKDDGQP